MLSAMLEEAGAAPSVSPILPDAQTAVERAVVAASARSDLVLVLAGSSRGGRDHTAAVLERCGRLLVRGVALRPAHPVLLAVVAGTPVIGVPGYPVSAALAVERFAAPVVALLAGAPPMVRETRRATLATAVLGRRDAELWVPLVLETRPDAEPLAWPQSRRGAALASLARAHATLTVPRGQPGSPPGNRSSSSCRPSVRSVADLADVRGRQPTAGLFKGRCVARHLHRREPERRRLVRGEQR
jgi:putative molybdopterin biosynthesis protein